MSAQGFGMFSQRRSGFVFVAAGTAAYAASSVSVQLPSGIQSGDLLLILAGSGNTLTPPSGWTVLVSNGDPTTFHSLWYKIAGSSETAPTVTGLSYITAVMVAYRNLTNTIDINGTVLYNGGSSTLVDTQTVTTTHGNDLVLSTYVSFHTAGAWITTPSGTLMRVNVAAGSFGPGDRGLLICDENQSAAGATAVREAGFTSGTGASGLTTAIY